MAPASPHVSTLDTVLRAFGLACNDAWCFAPSQTGRISHYSSEFLRLFGISRRTISDAESVLRSDDPRITSGCEKLGLPHDWLRSRVLAAPASDDGSVITTETEVLKITEKTLLDELGKSAGKLFFFSLGPGVGTFCDVMLRAKAARKDLAVLSGRESEILALVSSGLTNKAVASRANISEKTVEKHRANIMRKLRVRSAADLIRRVTEASLIADSDLP